MIEIALLLAMMSQFFIKQITVERRNFLPLEDGAHGKYRMVSRFMALIWSMKSERDGDKFEGLATAGRGEAESSASEQQQSEMSDPGVGAS